MMPISTGRIEEFASLEFGADPGGPVVRDYSFYRLKIETRLPARL
jgi:hypothetical protein